MNLGCDKVSDFFKIIILKFKNINKRFSLTDEVGFEHQKSQSSKMNRRNHNLLQPKLSLVKLELEENVDDVEIVYDGLKNDENYLIKMEQIETDEQTSKWSSTHQKRPPTPVNLPHSTSFVCFSSFFDSHLVIYLYEICFF